jgi:hypothetical protein
MTNPFKSVGHFFATVYSKAVAVIPKVEATETTVETVSANLPDAALILPVEKLGYAVLGELSAVLHAGGDAAKAKLNDAGLDIKVIAAVEALLKSIPQFAALVSTL